MRAIHPGKLAEIDQDVKDDQEELLDCADHFREHMAGKGHTSAMRCLITEIRSCAPERASYLLVAAITLLAGQAEERALEALLSETLLVEIGDSE